MEQVYLDQLDCFDQTELTDLLETSLDAGSFEPFHIANKYSDKHLADWYMSQWLLRYPDDCQWLFEQFLSLGFTKLPSILLVQTDGIDFIRALTSLAWTTDDLAQWLVQDFDTLHLVIPYLGSSLVDPNADSKTRQIIVTLPTQDHLIQVARNISSDLEEQIAEMLFTNSELRSRLQGSIMQIFGHSPDEIISDKKLRLELANSLIWLDELDSHDES